MHDWPEWQSQVEALTARLRINQAGVASLGAARIVFLGDSITQGWHGDVFRLFYQHRGGLNLGISGDATQSLLWRLDHGHWPAGLQPAAIILMVGTNNIGQGQRPEDVAIGIGRIIERLQRLSPSARILLLGVLPRGAGPQDPARQPIARLNQMIAACADQRSVLYHEPGSTMLDGQGQLHEWIAWDRLHLTQVGYAMLSAAIEAPLRQALQR